MKQSEWSTCVRWKFQVQVIERKSLRVCDVLEIHEIVDVINIYDVSQGEKTCWKTEVNKQMLVYKYVCVLNNEEESGNILHKNVKES